MTEDNQTHVATRIVRHPLLEEASPRPRVTFTLDGLSIEAYEGEPIAAALLAA